MFSCKVDIPYNAQISWTLADGWEDNQLPYTGTFAAINIPGRFTKETCMMGYAASKVLAKGIYCEIGTAENIIIIKGF